MSLCYEDCHLCGALVVKSGGFSGYAFCKDCDPDSKMYMYNYKYWGKKDFKEFDEGLNEIIREYQGMKMLKKLAK